MLGGEGGGGAGLYRWDESLISFGIESKWKCNLKFKLLVKTDSREFTLVPSNKVKFISMIEIDRVESNIINTLQSVNFVFSLFSGLFTFRDNRTRPIVTNDNMNIAAAGEKY